MEIISTSQLESVLEDGNVIIVDARGGADAYDRYKSGHLTGAIFVDLETDLSNKSANAADGGRHPLPEPGEFGKFLSKLNITPSSTVVAYDDKRGANAAARFWWMLKAAGVANVYVVSGGLESIVDEGLKLPLMNHQFLPFHRNLCWRNGNYRLLIWKKFQKWHRMKTTS